MKSLTVFILILFFSLLAAADEWVKISNERIADAIYLAEGGAKTRHPYGILKKFKTTTPRQACINTIAHAKRDYVSGDFIEFLGNRYAPVGADNDPNNLNKNWVKNVKYFLTKEEI